MQLGRRWQAGTPAPVLHPDMGVQEALQAEISAYERSNPSIDSWTLTFLEGKPRISADDGVTLTLDNALSPAWETTNQVIEDDDDWLS